jgi:glycosyltransferase involved in cell wall biosynthesis
MYKGKRIAVVIPAHNEEKFIGTVITTMPDFVDRMVVIDDASQDHTADVAGSVGDARLAIIRNKHNSGVGGAVRAGYTAALDGDCDIVVKMDGDGQMPPDQLGRLLDPLIEEGSDYAKGNRFLSRGGFEGMPASRVVGNVLLTFLNKFASGYWNIFDPQNGYTAITRKALSELNLAHVSPGFFFENDMLVQLNISGARVSDVAMKARYGDEESGIRVTRILLSFPMLFAHRLVRRMFVKYVLRDFSPIGLFFFLGGFLLLGGTLGGIGAWVRAAMLGVETPVGTALLILLPLVLGFQLLLQAIVLDIQSTPR